MEYMEKNDPSYHLIVQETDLLGNGLFMEKVEMVQVP